MNSFTFIKDFRDSEQHRRSFNDLTRRTYGFDFESWYRQGFWGDTYNPHALMDCDKIIANISVNKINLVIDGNDINAVQLGTVMTDEAYRNRGLSRELMHIILAEYEDTCDFIYLFANSSVLNFYPKFGFEKVTEYGCSTTVSNDERLQCRKLDIDNAHDQELLFRLIDSMIPSGKIGCRHDRGLVMFYCTTIYKDSIWYLPELDIAAVAHEEDGTLQLVEVFSEKELDLDLVAGSLLNNDNTKIEFGFTPKHENALLVLTPKTDEDDSLFVRSKHPLQLPKAMFPLLSKA